MNSTAFGLRVVSEFTVTVLVLFRSIELEISDGKVSRPVFVNVPSLSNVPPSIFMMP